MSESPQNPSRRSASIPGFCRPVDSAGVSDLRSLGDSIGVHESDPNSDLPALF
jgi:hypothetical protein